MSQERLKEQILHLNQQLLEAIATADWATYETLCAPTLTAFEPEARGHRVEGLDFHRVYFEAGPVEGGRHTTMVDPQVRLLGADGALVTFVRLVQGRDAQGWVTQRWEETRVWQRLEGEWRHIHFHRSENG